MNSINPIVDPTFLNGILTAIFVSDDPFSWPFSADQQARMLFYPTEGYHLSEDQYKAVVTAAREMGDDGFLVSIIEGQGNIAERGGHWWCEFPSYDQYLELPLVLENAVYSKSRKWGILISHEDHAVVGGNNQFIDKVREEYSGWDDDIRRLTEAWKDNPNGSWVETILSQE